MQERENRNLMKVFTATLPSPSISILSDQEWVSAIRLSRRMKPI